MDGGALDTGIDAFDSATDDGQPVLDGGPGPTSQGDAAECLQFDASAWSNCPTVPCPSGTICSNETGSAGPPIGNQSWCIPIPSNCVADPTCSCMGVCACTHGLGRSPESCSMWADGSVILCDNGLR
jgi:hypothetical protein